MFYKIYAARASIVLYLAHTIYESYRKLNVAITTHQYTCCPYMPCICICTYKHTYIIQIICPLDSEYTFTYMRGPDIYNINTYKCSARKV